MVYSRMLVSELPHPRRAAEVCCQDLLVYHGQRLERFI